MGPPIQETLGQSPQAQPERSPLSVNDGLYSRLERLSAILENFQSCSCPADCSGFDSAHISQASPSASEHPRTPKRPTRCRAVKKRSEARSRAEVLEEAEGTLEVQLARLGNDATGALRMSVQVTTDPDNQQQRGYYAEMYLARPGQEEEEFIGFIESWLILKPTAQGGPARNNDWQNLLDDENDTLSGTVGETARALQALYDRHGMVRPSIAFRATAEDVPGSERIDDDLGPRGTELVYIPCFWIDSEYSGNGIGPLALKMFYRLLMGGTLGQYNIGGRVTFILTPGLLADEDMVWYEKVGRRGNETQLAYDRRLAKTSVLALSKFYRGQGYRIYKGEVMGYSVGPLTADPGDRLLDRPNPPPLAPGGDTPQSRFSRDESGSIGVTQDELAALEQTGDYIRL